MLQIVLLLFLNLKISVAVKMILSRQWKKEDGILHGQTAKNISPFRTKMVTRYETVI